MYMYKIKRFTNSKDILGRIQSYAQQLADNTLSPSQKAAIQKKMNALKDKMQDVTGKMNNTPNSSNLPVPVDKSNTPKPNPEKPGWFKQGVDWTKNTWSKMGTAGKIGTVAAGTLAVGGLGYALGSSGKSKSYSDIVIGQRQFDAQSRRAEKNLKGGGKRGRSRNTAPKENLGQRMQVGRNSQPMMTKPAIGTVPEFNTKPSPMNLGSASGSTYGGFMNDLSNMRSSNPKPNNSIGKGTITKSGAIHFDFNPAPEAPRSINPSMSPLVPTNNRSVPAVNISNGIAPVIGSKPRQSRIEGGTGGTSSSGLSGSSNTKTKSGTGATTVGGSKRGKSKLGVRLGEIAEDAVIDSTPRPTVGSRRGRVGMGTNLGDLADGKPASVNNPVNPSPATTTPTPNVPEPKPKRKGKTKKGGSGYKPNINESSGIIDSMKNFYSKNKGLIKYGGIGVLGTGAVIGGLSYLNRD